MSVGVYAIREITCEYCRTVVKKRMNKGYRFCSPSCARRSYGEKLKKRVIISCKQCGKTFEAGASSVKSGRRKFCSRQCTNDYQKNKVICICEICQKAFEISVFYEDTESGKYCSARCRWKAGKSKIRPGTHHKIRELVCKGCGVKSYGRYSKRRKYCSHSCFMRSIIKRWRDRRTIICRFCEQIAVKCGFSSRYKNRFCNRGCADTFQVQDEESKVRLRKIRASQNKKLGPNKLELAGRAVLVDLGLIPEIDFEEQCLINDKFIVDVYIPKFNVIIEWDGDYWHGNPDRYKNLDDTQTRINNKDRAENNYLVKCGFDLLRFWECEVKRSPDSVKNRIRLILEDYGYGGS